MSPKKILQIYEIVVQHLFLQFFLQTLITIFANKCCGSTVCKVLFTTSFFAICCSRELIFCNLLFQRMYFLQFYCSREFIFYTIDIDKKRFITPFSTLQNHFENQTSILHCSELSATTESLS